MTTIEQGDELVAAPTAEAAGARRFRLPFLGGFLFGLLAVLVVAAAAFAAFEASYAGRVLPGVRVGGVDLSGLTVEQAAGRLATESSVLAAGELVLTAPDASRSVAYGDLGRRLDIDGLVAQAMAVGRTGDPLARLATDIRTALGGLTLAPVATFDDRALQSAVALLIAEIDQAPVDAAVRVEGTRFVVSEATVGRAADRAAALAAAAAALQDPAAPARIDVAVDVRDLEPAVTTAMAQEARDAALRVVGAIDITDGTETWAIDADMVRTWLSFGLRADGRYGVLVDEDAIAAALAPIATAAARAPVNAGWIIEDDHVAGVVPALTGRELDIPATVGALIRLTDQRRAGIPMTGIDLPGGPFSQPALTTAQAEELAPQLVKISSWTTYFPYGVRNGNGANIWIPAGDLDGLVLMPDEWFDFWDRIGPVTYERGYREGGAIINGRSEPQGALAGGICSCSTTLFNAALRAGLEMGARRNHYYYISRYPMGLDATVFRSSSGSTQTVSFRNDTEAPILISTSGWRVGDKGYVNFTFWSLPTGRTVALSKPVVSNVKPSIETVEYTNDLPYGKSERVEYAVDGMDVSVTRVVRDASGAIIHQDTYVSHYARMTGITLIGTRGAPTPTPVPSPTAAPSPTATPVPS